MIVYILNPQQRVLITGREFMPDNYFNPIQDANDNWIITNEEIENCTIPEFDWIHELQEIEFEPNNNNNE